jgi:hypothetical protein
MADCNLETLVGRAHPPAFFVRQAERLPYILFRGGTKCVISATPEYSVDLHRFGRFSDDFVEQRCYP